MLAPGTPLGLLTNAVQTLAGVLLPSATVFLLLLCNDKAVLGPWVNSRGINLFTGAVIAVLVMLSIVLTASVLYPDISGDTIVEIVSWAAALLGHSLLSWSARACAAAAGEPRPEAVESHRSKHDAGGCRRSTELRARCGSACPAGSWMIVLRGYLVVAGGLVLVRIVELALGAGN